MLLTDKIKNHITQTLFVIDNTRSTTITNDFSNLFLQEKTSDYVGEQTLDNLKVTGKEHAFGICQ